MKTCDCHGVENCPTKANMVWYRDGEKLLEKKSNGDTYMKGHGTLNITGDMTTCLNCGKSWDTNDPHPPSCKSEWSPWVLLIIAALLFILAQNI